MKAKALMKAIASVLGVVIYTASAVVVMKVNENLGVVLFVAPLIIAALVALGLIAYEYFNDKED